MTTNSESAVRTEDTTFRLTLDEAHQFHTQGYLGPFPTISPEEMAKVNEALHNRIFLSDGPNPNSRTHSRHLDTRTVYDLLAHPSIVHRLASLLGDDVMVWSSGFFIKDPHGKGLETPWHQDINYWPIEPQINITAWIATEEVTAENAPLLLIPGSHRQTVPHIKNKGGKAFNEEADPAYVDHSQAVTMAMRPGEAIIFSEKLLHGSPVNRSNRRRCALSARYSIPLARLFHGEPPMNFPGHHAVMVSGEDRFGFNRLGPPPEA